MNITKMTRKQFDEVPWRKEYDTVVLFDSLVILPGRANDIHDSGYRNMDFVAVRSDEPVCRLSGCSDVIHIEGIAGYGKDWVKKYDCCPSSVPPRSWSIDCLPKSGLLHLFCGCCSLEAGAAVSSFEICSVPKQN